MRTCELSPEVAAFLEHALSLPSSPLLVSADIGKRVQKTASICFIASKGPDAGCFPSVLRTLWMWSMSYVHDASLLASSGQTTPRMAKLVLSPSARPRDATWFLSEVKLILL